MRPSTKVEFIEKVDKSILGLDGLMIVVRCDKTSGDRNRSVEITNFEEIGRKCLNKINGEYIKNKYGLSEGIALKNKLHEERIFWIKSNI